jgi:hypothetical protein
MKPKRAKPTTECKGLFGGIKEKRDSVYVLDIVGEEPIFMSYEYKDEIESFRDKMKRIGINMSFYDAFIALNNEYNEE